MKANEAPEKIWVHDMREIKFRGKDLKTKEWVYGNLSHYEGVKDVMIECVDHDDKKMLVTTHFVNLDTIGQMTNVKDYKGKDIYEGDIVKTSICEGPFGIVTWHQDGYFFIDDLMERNPKITFAGSYRPLGEMVREKIVGKRLNIEVIGNKWDNPELLNK